VVRNIQLRTLADVARVRERLDAGEDFGELAARYSANMASSANRGLLGPFSAQDERAPSVLREVAFSLQPGEVSDALRMGNWHHLVKLEEVLPGEERGFEKMRPALERGLRERVTEPAMVELFEKLLDAAMIEIHDPALAKTLEREYPDRRR
jgi:parvulin-like peptidyl-prolyl isomerase